MPWDQDAVTPREGIEPVRFGRGWKPEPDAERSLMKSSRDVFGAPHATYPDEMSLEGHIKFRRNQKWTSMCVGAGTTNCASIRTHIITGQEVRYSMQAAYTVGREYAHRDLKEPLRDAGSIPMCVILGMAQWGLTLDNVWPGPDSEDFGLPEYDEGTLNQALPPDVLMDGAMHKFVGVHAVDSWEDCLHAWSLGFPVGMGTQVGASWDNYQAGDPPLEPETDPNAGGHFTCLLGRSGDVALDLNSWGNWGDNGIGRVHRRVLEDKRTQLYVFEIG